MKVKLTLEKGAFYFFNSINLLNGQEQEVDLDTLTASEKRGLLSNIKSGYILSDKDISTELSETQEATQEQKVDKEVKEEENAVEETPEAPKEDAIEQEKEAPNTTNWDKARYKKELDTLGVPFQSNMSLTTLAKLYEAETKDK